MFRPSVKSFLDQELLLYRYTYLVAVVVVAAAAAFLLLLLLLVVVGRRSSKKKTKAPSFQIGRNLAR